MKANFLFKPFGVTIKATFYVGSILLLPACAWSQNLFVGVLAVSQGYIYEFSPGGVQSTFASGANAPVFPFGLTFNSAGDLFAADPFSGNIYEFTPGGVQSTFASGLRAPYGLAFNNAGDLFEADSGSGNIYEFTPGGAKSTFASGVVNPTGLAFNSAGDLFAIDDFSGNIYEFTPGGVRSTFATPAFFPYGLAFNSAGDLFVTDGGRGNNNYDSIYEFTPDGAQSTFVTVTRSDQFPPVLLSNLAFNSSGNLFVTDPNYGVYEFTPGGKQSTFASVNGAVGMTFQPVPEPSFPGLLAIGAAALFASRLNSRTRSLGLNRIES